MNESSATYDKISSWLLKYISDMLNVPIEDISIDKNFDVLGLDSLGILEMTGDLEEQLTRELSATIALEYPSVAELSRHIAEESL